MSEVNLKIVIEAALFASAEPLTPEHLQQLFDEQNPISLPEIKNLLSELKEDYRDRGVALQEVASGYRFRARPDFSPWLQRLWKKKPARYSRALLETLALIVYRQPISRGEIEKVRGVAVSSDIIKKLLDREWISVVAHRDVPGKPALFGTTKTFLNYFNLKSLEELPPLEEVVNLEKIEVQFDEQLALVIEKKAPEGTEPSTLPFAEED
ncbi:SMC-Scp complex subunit ScpB [Coxiella endosymbiont of Ornithodoros amblus]|uniref:SMC-Scp complex subunit ScpB n=1 Tax=Coxiella endosymbiont of Ornithodoros amblus TaxID=1656166 RepID=UPI00244D9E15|nr:SMC-Scp complex subunit ScpB [Coxiella endosymbiont of Ornithodoros amblus]MBW5802852.1 SMC-Scp complex subunit ScpB [Coxiella endosymbiont of Ornithodoros amblus]